MKDCHNDLVTRGANTAKRAELHSHQVLVCQVREKAV